MTWNGGTSSWTWITWLRPTWSRMVSDSGCEVRSRAHAGRSSRRPVWPCRRRFNKSNRRLPAGILRLVPRRLCDRATHGSVRRCHCTLSKTSQKKLDKRTCLSSQNGRESVSTPRLATGPAWFSPLGFRDNRIANTLFEQLGIVAYLVKEATRQCGWRLASVLPVANSVDSHAKEASKQRLAQAENTTDFLDLLPRVNLGFQVQFDRTYGESAGDSLATPLFEDLVELGQRVHDLRAVSSKLLFSHRILPCVSSSSMSRMIWLIALQSASPRSSFSFFP